MEYVKVKYPESRSVLIDEEESGATNTKLRVDRGTHTFSLAEPRDFKPESITIKVIGTTPKKPMEVRFEKI
jgi:hypothetical protein